MVCHCWCHWNFLKFGWIWWYQLVYRLQSDFECFKRLQSLLWCYQFGSLPLVHFEYDHNDSLWIGYWRAKKLDKKKWWFGLDLTKLMRSGVRTYTKYDYRQALRQDHFRAFLDHHLKYIFQVIKNFYIESFHDTAQIILAFFFRCPFLGT